jgi:AbrB family looped-hinge helix DNA binding protein
MVAGRIILPINEDGHISIPTSTREDLGLKPGDLVELTIVRHGSTNASRETTPFLELAGVLPPLERFRDDEDMTRQIHEATGDAVARRLSRK